MLRRAMLLAVAIAALGVGLGACGDDDEEQGATPPAQTEAAPPAEEPEAGGGETLQLAADPGGDLAYDTTELSAPAGPVTIELTNESPVPHNVVLEREGEDVAESETIESGNTSVDAELEAGEYTFYCSVANHRDAGMEGTLTVE